MENIGQILKKICNISWNSVHSSSLWSGHKLVNAALCSTNYSLQIDVLVESKVVLTLLYLLQRLE